MVRQSEGPRRFLLGSLVVVAMLASLPSQAAAIPAWLDQAITDWNKANTARPIEFVDIKDSFVWYRVAKASENGGAEGRARLYSIAESAGYKKTSEEELVTTAKPPVASGAAQSKKCWSRSFTYQVTTGQERLLSSLVCEDGGTWMMGFRVVQ